MPLTSGKWVWVIGTLWEITDYTEGVIAAMREFAANNPTARAGIASGNAEGVPLLLDVASTQPPDQNAYDTDEDS